ncbi:sugar ABC transporter permease [Clostridia bacterium]|nr:sugar ABC transporter permease [Clostridia bacterium]
MTETIKVKVTEKHSKKKIRISGILITAILVCLAVTALMPVVFVAANSFMDSREIMKSYSGIMSGSGNIFPHIIPERATLMQYAEVFWLKPDYLVKFWNSIFITLAIVTGQIIVSCMGGYGFAKFSFPLKKLVFFLLIILMMMPYQVTLVPQYLMLDKMGLIGSYAAVILPGIVAPFGIFLLTQVFSSVPDNITEAAKIDGASNVQILFRIIFPYARTGIASLFILSFIDNWNMVEQPLVFLSDPKKYPLSIFLCNVNMTNFGVAFVCGILAMIPVVIIFLYLKESLIYGIETSNLK